MMNYKMEFVKIVNEKNELVKRNECAMAYSKEVARKQKQKAKDIYAMKLIGETLLVFPLFVAFLFLCTLV